MREIKLRDDFTVTLIDSYGSDHRVCQAARVSTLGAESFDSSESAGLINFLMKNRHGSPFEHIYLTWLISAPLFVWREFMRHRMANYNEESGRYKQLEPVFYVPPRHRPLVQVGKTGAYEFVPGSDKQYEATVRELKAAAAFAYEGYEGLLERNVAKEVARMQLPLNIYSSAYVTMNARALMNFLSLRTQSDKAAYESFPQWEIAQVAEAMESTFVSAFPVVANAFQTNGRVQP